MATDKSYKIISSDVIVMRLLEHFGTLHEPTGAVQISKELDLPIGTVMTHLYTLTSLGYLNTIGSSYELSNKLAEIWAARKRYLANNAQKINKQFKEIDV
jgi:DNA-binding IclR family transcriptional regulator